MVRVSLSDDENTFFENAGQDHILFIETTNALIKALNLNVPFLSPFEFILRETRDPRDFTQINLQFHLFLNDTLHSILASLPNPVIFLPKMLPASDFNQLKMVEYIIHRDLDMVFQKLEEDYNVSQAV
jgi:hypothetical protein